MAKSSFLNAPTALGSQNNANYVNLGSISWVKVSEEIEQKKPAFKAVFKSYAEYQAFTQFCAYSPLVLGYMPIDKWAYLECELASITKTEMGLNGLLECDVVFTGRGLWYETVQALKPDINLADSKKYSYTYSYKYANGAANTVKFNNTGTKNSPCIIYIFGPCAVPQWRLVNNGAIIATGKMDITISTGNVLIINPAPDKMEIGVYQSGTMQFLYNAYANSDFTTQRFIYAPPGENTITFSNSGGTNVEAEVGAMQLADTL